MRIHSLIAVLFAVLGVIGGAATANAGLFVPVGVAPPPLPAYLQPPIPGPGYIWTPGYWAWDEGVSDYYWVPGAWTPAPEPGFLWTPGYWAWNDGAYVWNAGYWGPEVGFYGGIDYGFGYTGVGFAGGYWSGGTFSYNRACTNIGRTAFGANVYNRTVIAANSTNISFNGGDGGVRAQPTLKELQAASAQHLPPTKDQLDHEKLASQTKELRASVNKGRPAIAAVMRAGDFSPKNAFAAKRSPEALKPAPVKTSFGSEGRQTATSQTRTTFPAQNQLGHGFANANGFPVSRQFGSFYGAAGYPATSRSIGGRVQPQAASLHRRPANPGPRSVPRGGSNGPKKNNKQSG